MNYYEILGVTRDSSAQEIKKAYKKLARKWHPDLNKDNLKVAEEKMREINVAYDTLSDEVKRSDYNRKLDAEPAAGASRKTSAGTQRTSQRTSQKKSSAPGSGKVDFDDIHSSFESFFGFNPRTREVTNEDKLNTFAKQKKKKNPLDTTDFFERFMGFKK
ncbi:MAG: DnaJ domain-containing protein [Selenomonadaceae bacterium]|nr:DnaJ domain-containing protein [Selenomonadaceae bacterium]